MKAPIRDIDLMRLADGELDAEERAELEAALAADPAAADKMTGLRDIGELVRGDLEVAADRAEPRFAKMWREIDKQIDLGTPARRPTRAEPAAAVGFWGRVTRWIDTYRGHVLTGALSAGAVAAVALAMRPSPPSKVETAQVTAPAPVVAVQPAPVKQPDVIPVHQPAEVESVDVPTGQSTVFTIPDPDGDGNDTTTVIWVTPDDTVKGIQ